MPPLFTAATLITFHWPIAAFSHISLTLLSADYYTFHAFAFAGQISNSIDATFHAISFIFIYRLDAIVISSPAFSLPFLEAFNRLRFFDIFSQPTHFDIRQPHFHGHITLRPFQRLLRRRRRRLRLIFAAASAASRRRILFSRDNAAIAPYYLLDASFSLFCHYW